MRPRKTTALLGLGNSSAENGHVAPRWDVVLRLVNVLEVRLDYLADREKELNGGSVSTAERTPYTTARM
jgi:hypothetical protein